MSDIRSFFGKPKGTGDSKCDDIIVKKSTTDNTAKRKPEEESMDIKIASGTVNVCEDGGKKRIRMENPPANEDHTAPTLYKELTDVFESIEQTTKRLEIQQLLKDYFLQLLANEPKALSKAVDLCCCQVAPAFHGVELGVGDGLLKKSLAKVTGRNSKSINDMYQNLGDLGSVAKDSKASQSTLFGLKKKPLSLVEVHAQFGKIATLNKADMKSQIIERMLVAASAVEAKFLIRGLQAKLRIGLAEQTVLIALAHSLTDYHWKQQKQLAEKDDTKLSWCTGPESYEKAVVMLKQVYSELPIYDEILEWSLKPTAQNEMWYDVLRKHCTIRAGVPLKPMLAKPTNGISQVLDRFQDISFTCEYKYDGERAQIHMEMKDDKPMVKIYSRNSEDNTLKYPDVCSAIPYAISTDPEDEFYVSSFILDSEAVAYDVQKQALLPFQKLSTRARKDVDEESIKVQVIVCGFDLLYLNGKSLLETSLVERRELLRKYFKPVENKFCFASSFDGSTTEDIEAFLNKAVEDQCEGLMIKTLEGPDSFYQPARRSLNWLKLKKDYLNNLADSFDLVPIGAYYGKGKRTGTFGAYILAAYDEDDEEYQSVTKIGTGFSDKDLEDFTNFFKDKTLENKPSNFLCDMVPDVWFEPSQVWEVRAADLSISPIHKAAMGKIDPAKGIALRFPRFLRIRDDKPCDNATSATQVADMYLAQNLTTASSNNDDEDDCY